MKDKTGAVLNRLVIIPFSARFSSKDKDYDPEIKYKLCMADGMEYLIALAVAGLKRVVGEGGRFTSSDRVDKQIAEYERENNPISGFIEENDIDDIINNSTADVYAMYQVYCKEGNHTPLSKVVFSRQINERLGTDVVVKNIKGKSIRVFVLR
jgi:putative DNA primase/helicase